MNYKDQAKLYAESKKDLCVKNDTIPEELFRKFGVNRGLRDENGNLITESAYRGKTIDVVGIVDYFSGAYQIKVFTAEDIKVH